MQNLMLTHDIGMFTARDLPRQVLPLLEHIDETRPDIVIACDRGARPIGIAMLAAWKHTRDERFPTIDHSIHFARISTSVAYESMRERISQIHSKVTASIRDAGPVPARRIDTILFVDDWTVQGETAKIAASLAADIDASSTFATLCGTKADISAHPHVPVALGSILTSWRDNQHQLGVEYSSNSDSQVAISVPTRHSRHLRQMIHEGTHLIETKHSS